MTVYIRIFIKGRVQGVFFRAFVKKHAVKLNIRGYAKNLLDGSVEIAAHGNQVSISQLVAHCHKGPLLAKVEEVMTHQSHEIDLPNDFHII